MLPHACFLCSFLKTCQNFGQINNDGLSRFRITYPTRLLNDDAKIIIKYEVTSLVYHMNQSRPPQTKHTIYPWFNI